ncbi:MAG: hypothetical protein HZB56_17920 [Deltaproteobacteria bacterium]|nr:hypothetical protein [Deltaproteobacteria bacterium]
MLTTTLLAVALAAEPAAAPPPRPHLLVLGVFHFANPGRDMFNLAVDDVLAPRRQQEMAEVVEVLKAFRPTRIAVEAPLGSARVAEEYAAVRAGRRPLGRNEVEQLGYRLARELGHPAVHPVDVEGEFPFEPVADFAKRAGREAELEAILASIPVELRRVEGALQKGTLLDALRVVNSEELVRRDRERQVALARFAGGGAYPGPDLAAAWYRRNARIYANLRALATSPQDRILVIYGSGHLHWLQQLATDGGDVVLERLEEYAARRPAR